MSKKVHLDPAFLERLTQPPFALDAAALAWVRATLDRLTPEQRLRQLFNVGLSRDDPEAARALAASGVGAVTRFVGADLEAAYETNRVLIEGADVPLLISGDLEGGAIAPAAGSQWPNALGVAAAADLALSTAVSAASAEEARALGYNWTFAPVVDINAAFRSAIVATRSFGSRPEVILAQARHHVAAFQAAGIAATAKHWPGEGYDDRDQHLVTTLNPLSMPQWRERFGHLYAELIADGVMSVMAGHIALPAYAHEHGVQGLETCRPATVSALLNFTLLRGELGFNGLIVSDATGMAGLSSWGPRAQGVPEVIAHGCDMLLFPASLEGDLAHLHDALADGRLTWQRVHEAVARVLAMKAALGLHRDQPSERLLPLGSVRALLRNDAHRALEDRVASASVTLVKDERGLLPLSPQRHRRVVLITDPQPLGFAAQPPLPLRLHDLLQEEGFEVRAFDAEQPPTADNADLVLYVLTQESLLTLSHVFLDWRRLQGRLGGAMQRYWHELPCALISFGHPYYLYDVPRMPCVINAYTAVEPVQRAVLRKLLGREPFKGVSPVDASCGLPDALPLPA